MNNNYSEVNNIVSMIEDQEYSIDSSIFEENTQTNNLISDSFKVFLQQFFWLFASLKSVCCKSKLCMLDYAPPSLLDTFINASSTLSPLLDLQHCVPSKSLRLITFQNKFFSVSIVLWPIWCLSIYPSPIILTFIHDQILSKITTSIIFDIAKEEGLHDEDYKSPVIDNLLWEFQFQNKLIPN